MQQMEAHFFCGGLERFPSFLGEISPDRVHQFDADREMPEKFPAQFRYDTESTLGRTGFPELSRVVE